MFQRARGRIVFQPTVVLGSQSNPRRARTLSRPGLESLETRELLTASLQPISNITLSPGSGFQVPLVGPSNTNQTYTVTSDNSQVQAAVSPGQFLTINVSHTAANSSDISFSGSMTFQLFDNLTPIAASRIEQLVTQGFYTNTTFYRIPTGFPGATDYVVQGGAGTPSQSGFPFGNEILPQLTFNGNYQLAMANTGAPNSNASSFFVTTVPVSALNGGYTIFGQLVSGQNIVQDMTKVTMGGTSPYNTDSTTTPLNPITITSASTSTANPDGVININAVNAQPGQTAHVTVTATDPSTNTTATQTFTVTTAGSSAVVGGTSAVRLVGQVLVVDPPAYPGYKHAPPYNITVDQVNGNIVTTVNGVTDNIQPAASGLQYIVVYGTKGNDNITITPNVTVPATIDGGHGGKNVLSGAGGTVVEHGWYGYTRMIGGPFDSLIGRKGRVKFLPQGGQSQTIFAGVARVTQTRTFAPYGTFYTLVNNKLVPVSQAVHAGKTTKPKTTTTPKHKKV